MKAVLLPCYALHVLFGMITAMFLSLQQKYPFCYCSHPKITNSGNDIIMSVCEEVPHLYKFAHKYFSTAAVHDLI